MGLGRALSKMGFCSRSEAFALIRSGRVRLNGVLTKNPEAAVRLRKDAIEVDRTPVHSAVKVYWMMNKPRSLVTTAHDEQGRETVYAQLPKGLPWMSPVGRLDRASEGLLLFTNDSEWAARILAPESHLDKTYHVQIGTVAQDKLLRSLERGVTVEDGELLRAKRVRRVREGEKNSWIEVVLHQGRNRQIRRMLQQLGIETLRLIRVSIGPLKLGDLAKGAAREVTATEKAEIDGALRAVSLQQTRLNHTGNSQ